MRMTPFERAAKVATCSQLTGPLSRRLRQIADNALAEIGLSQATGWVLLHVARLGGEPRQTDLATAVDMNGPGLVRLLDNLEASGLVQRQVEAADRRINRIRLTDAGRALTDQVE